MIQTRDSLFWYTACMRIWDYDPATLAQGDIAERWQLERGILYGLAGTKLNAALLKKHLPFLRIPPEHRRFLTLILA